MSTEVAEYVFDAPAPARLYLSNIRGEVIIHSNPNQDAPVIRVHAEKHTQSGDANHTQIEVAQGEGGLVRVETRYNDLRTGAGLLSQLLGGGKPCRVTYTVEVPQQTSLELHCVSSDASVTGLVGSLRFDMVSGNFTLDGLEGDVNGKTVSGDIQANRVKSSMLQLDSVSGNIRLAGSQIEAVRAKTISGDITIETPLKAGGYHFRTISGNVRLIVPSDSRCTIEASSLSGAVHSDLPFTGRRSGGRQRCEVQGGGTPVELHSTSGDLFISQSGHAPAPGWQDAPIQEDFHAWEDEHTSWQEPSGPQPVSVPLSRQEILERIERGELSVEEGIQLLQSS